jgi:cytochrome b involved in lipid metabolism
MAHGAKIKVRQKIAGWLVNEKVYVYDLSKFAPNHPGWSKE